MRSKYHAPRGTLAGAAWFRHLLLNSSTSRPTRMGSPPIPDRSPEPPGPTTRPSAVNFSPPKRRTGGSLKGKEHALDDNTYPGEITYRHLLGGGGGPSYAHSAVAGTVGQGAKQHAHCRNPLRAIAHIDIDAAYAAMEMAVSRSLPGSAEILGRRNASRGRHCWLSSADERLFGLASWA